MRVPDYITSAACIALTINVDYIFFLVATQGYAKIIEPNPIVLISELIMMAAISILVILRFARDIADAKHKKR